MAGRGIWEMVVLGDHPHKSSVLVAPQAQREHMLVLEEPHGGTPRLAACRLLGGRVPGAPHRYRIPKRLMTVGGVEKIVHGVPAES